MVPEKDPDIHQDGEKLLQNIKAHMGEIKKVLRLEPSELPLRFEFGEDAFYRFYHQSCKVYGLQNTTETIVELMSRIGQESGVEACTKLNR